MEAQTLPCYFTKNQLHTELCIKKILELHSKQECDIALSTKSSRICCSQLTLWSKALLGKIIVAKIFPTFDGTWRFNAVFTRASHCSLSWTTINLVPAFTFYLRLIGVLSFDIYLGLPSGLFPSGFPTKPLHTFLFPPCVPHAPPISSWIYHPNNGWWWVKNSEVPHYTIFSLKKVQSYGVLHWHYDVHIKFWEKFKWGHTHRTPWWFLKPSSFFYLGGT